MRMKEDIVNFFINDETEYSFNIQMLGISYCDGTYRIERKNSNIYVFEYIIEGQGTVLYDNEEYKPVKGDIYILHHGKDHIYFSDEKKPWTKIWFNIYGPLVDHLIDAYKLNNICHIQGLDLETLFFQMLELSRNTNIETKELFDEAALLFHKIIIKIADKTKYSKSIPITLAQKLKQYIEQNAENNLSLNDLSSIILKSPSQTIRLFKKEFNISPYEYLLIQKIEIAKLLLLNTRIPIKEIAYRLHFADEHYFSNCFKSRTGISPMKFRSGGFAQ
jgi:AraC family transcriptional regulator, arabinose operon regulatory protein